MTMIEESWPLDPGAAKYTDYNVRRADAITWEIRLSPEFVAKRLASLEAEAAPDESEIADLKESADRWLKLDGAISSPLETHYQRFLLHYLRS
jgi:hypothetical protein